jgi:hypothetical protein
MRQASREIAAPGTLGRLELRAEVEAHGTVRHEGDYQYVGVVRGKHAFAPAGDEPVLYLHRDEVVSFKAVRP